MRHVALLALLTLAACSKKEPPPVTHQPASAATGAAPSAGAPSTDAAGPSAVPVEGGPAGAPMDDAIEGEFAFVESFALPEGKLLPLPTFKPATKEAAKAHSAALQPEFEAMVKEGFKEQGRFNASFVPATYVLMMHADKASPGPNGSPSEEWTMLAAEGDAVHREPLALRNASMEDRGSTEPFSLMQTSRGYFVDAFGDDTLVYVLRRRGRPWAHEHDTDLYLECRGKAWHHQTGAVFDVAVPDYPGRGKDVDGDGKNEFPAARFSFPLRGIAWKTPPAMDEACNLRATGAASIAVLGVTSMVEHWDEASDAIKAFYERRLAASRKRADKVRAWAGAEPTPKAVTRRSGGLRFDNRCALDVAQTAAELYVYARTLGEGEAAAIAEADALMKGFTLQPLRCTGTTRLGPVVAEDLDFWPELRKGLLAAKLSAVTGPKPSPSTSANAPPPPAAPSASAQP